MKDRPLEAIAPVTPRSAAPTTLIVAALLLTTSVVHAMLVPEHLREQPYIGWLFVLGSACAAIAAAALALRPTGVAWAASVAVTAAMLTSYLLSRSTGLPGYMESWTDHAELAVIAVAAESAVIATGLDVLRVAAAAHARD